MEKAKSKAAEIDIPATGSSPEPAAEIDVSATGSSPESKAAEIDISATGSSPEPAAEIDVSATGSSPESAAEIDVSATGSSPESKAAEIDISATGFSSGPVSSFPSLEELRLPQHFLESVGVKKLLLNVPIRKPGPQEFVRVHPDQAYRFPMLMLELRGDGQPEIFLVHPDLAGVLEGETKMTVLHTTISRQGVVFLWPITIPPAGARPMLWWSSAAEAAALARDHWLRLKPNMSLGGYEVFLAEDQVVEPQWPTNLPAFRQLLELAAKGGRLITDISHPAIKALRGG